MISPPPTFPFPFTPFPFFPFFLSFSCYSAFNSLYFFLKRFLGMIMASRPQWGDQPHRPHKVEQLSRSTLLREKVARLCCVSDIGLTHGLLHPDESTRHQISSPSVLPFLHRSRLCPHRPRYARHLQQQAACTQCVQAVRSKKTTLQEHTNM